MCIVIEVNSAPAGCWIINKRVKLRCYICNIGSKKKKTNNGGIESTITIIFPMRAHTILLCTYADFCFTSILASIYLWFSIFSMHFICIRMNCNFQIDNLPNDRLVNVINYAKIEILTFRENSLLQFRSLSIVFFVCVCVCVGFQINDPQIFFSSEIWLAYQNQLFLIVNLCKCYYLTVIYLSRCSIKHWHIFRCCCCFCWRWMESKCWAISHVRVDCLNTNIYFPFSWCQKFNWLCQYTKQSTNLISNIYTKQAFISLACK